jgi:excisionase family DNA binding protein
MMDREQSDRPDRSISTMLTTGDVARIFNVHPGTIRRWSEQGIIKAYRVGPRGYRRFSREEVAVLYFERKIRKYLKE